MLEERCAHAGKRAGGILRFGRGLWTNARGGPGVNTCTILENVSKAAQMEGDYSMTLKMGLRGLGRWSA